MRLEWNPPKIQSVDAVFSWGDGSDADEYITEVYTGETSAGGIVGIDRPWCEVTFKRVHVPALVSEGFQRNPRSLTAAFEFAAEKVGEDFQNVINYYNWGIQSNNYKQFRPGKTWQTITDSGNLVDSQRLKVVPHA